MTRVCLVGSEDVTLQYELLSRETSREALATYDLYEPFENAVGVETVSLGAAVALLNDLDWYLTRFVDERGEHRTRSRRVGEYCDSGHTLRSERWRLESAVPAAVRRRTRLR